MLSFKRKLTKKTLYRIGTIKLETWGGVASVLFEKNTLFLYVLLSIEIKIGVQASWLLYILYSPPIFKNKRCYVHAKHLCLQITNYLMNPGQLYQNM